MKALLFCLFAFLPVSAAAQDLGEEFRSDDIHSDLPLYGFDEPEFWPRSFIPDEIPDENWIGGCATRVRVGDWQFIPNSADEFGDTSWMRITNYGVIHCAAILRDDYDREYLAEAPSDPGFFVQIGEATSDGEPIELWAIQRGAHPGSAFTLLARAPDDEIIESFIVLQQRCPDGAMRIFEGNLDILRTDYCAINSKEDMLALATNMLDYPPLGTMRRMGDSDWEPPEPEAAEEHEPPEPEDGSFLLDALESEQQ